MCFSFGKPRGYTSEVIMSINVLPNHTLFLFRSMSYLKFTVSLSGEIHLTLVLLAKPLSFRFSLFFFYCLLDVLLHVDFNNNMPQSLGLWRVPIWGWMTPLLGRRLKKDFQIYTFNDNDTTCYLLFSPGYPTPEEEEARRIAEMGKPILGEYSRLEVMIEESCEFKVMELLQADKHGLHFRINFKLQH